VVELFNCAVASYGTAGAVVGSEACPPTGIIPLHCRADWVSPINAVVRVVMLGTAGWPVLVGGQRWAVP